MPLLLLISCVLPPVLSIHTFRHHQRREVEYPSQLRSIKSPTPRLEDIVEQHNLHAFEAESSRDVNQDYLKEVSTKIEDLRAQPPAQGVIAELTKRVEDLEGAIVGGSLTSGSSTASVDPAQVADIKELTEDNKIFSNILRTDLDNTTQLVYANDAKQTQALSTVQEQLTESIATKFSSLSMDFDSLKNQGASADYAPQIRQLETDVAALKTLTQTQQQTVTTMQTMSSDTAQVQQKLWETLQGQVAMAGCAIGLLALIVALVRGGGSKPASPEQPNNVSEAPAKEEVPEPATAAPAVAESEEEEEPI